MVSVLYTSSLFGSMGLYALKSRYHSCLHLALAINCRLYLRGIRRLLCFHSQTLMSDTPNPYSMSKANHKG